MKAKVTAAALTSVTIQWKLLPRAAVLGFVLGYAVLHPISMLIFKWVDPRIPLGPLQQYEYYIWQPIIHSFQVDMLPMGLLFGLVGAVITSLQSYHRLTVTAQRDRLAHELATNEKFRAELARQAEELKRKNEHLAKLEQTNRRTSQFMAHDFKTPLSCITGFATLLLEKPELQRKSDVVDALHRIQRQASKMKGAVSDLLDFAKLGEKSKLKREELCVSKVLREVLSEFSLPSHSERISLAKKHVGCPAVYGAPRLLNRVLVNLIANALNHNSPGTRVTVDAEIEQPSGSHVQFSCCDDGDGIPAEHAPLVFNAFVSGGGREGSTGLGLAFCKAVLEAHGGRIWFESQQGTGTQFFFTVPRYKEDKNV